MIKIEGKVDVDLDESSDSEPEEELTPSGVMEQTIEVSFENTEQVDEEEEVEYFGPNSKHAKQQPEPKLASILSAKVKEVENNPTSSAQTNSETTDEFGIAYQPKRRNFNTSEGPPLLVVEEFDEEIATRLLNTTAKPVDEEDEFDLDIESNENNTENSETIRKALENAALAATTASNQELPTTTTKTPAAQEVPVSGSSASAGVATFASIMEEAKNALAEVAEVYGSGLGDHEVHLMFSSSQQVENGSNSNNTAQQQTATLGCVGAIEEGDEEAAELEEELEEVRAVETVKAAAEATSQLESEWDNLDPARTGKPSSGPTDDVKCTQESTTSLSAVVVTEKWKYSKALQLFKTADHSAYIGSIVVREEGKGGWFSAAPKPLSYTGWKEDLDLPFLLAQIDYDPQSRAHYGMLSTIYSTLLLVDGEGNSSSSSSSKKWEKLGFQGNDPRTDLNRSMKMLSVVQMLSYIEHDTAAVRRVFDLSQSAQDPAGEAAQSISIAERNARAEQDTSWPFMCVAIMFTKEALQCLRRGVLNDKCNKRKTVFGVINEFHRACFAEFESLLQAQPAVHHAVHLAALRKMCESNPLKLMKKWKEVPRSTQQAAAPARGSQQPATADSNFRFDNLESVQEKAVGEEGSGSSWSSVFTDRKAAKFAAV